MENCVFLNNHGIASSGAIKIVNAGTIHLKNNLFANNLASQEISPITDWRFCDAGAIYYMCQPGNECDTILENNTFQNNTALNKGGAIRYVHKNFTTVFQSKSDGRRVLLSSRALQSADEDDFGDTNSYVDNKAAYANDLGSFPSYFKYKLQQNGLSF